MNLKRNVYQLVTERIIERLAAGVVPWHRPWTGVGAPRNLISMREYNGINVFLLASMGYESPYWLTWHQLKRLGGYVKKGEKATPVVFWKRYESKTDETDKNGNRSTKNRSFLRHFSVFNVVQCQDIAQHILQKDEQLHEFNPIAAAESVVTGMPQQPIIEHGHQQASYMPSRDTVRISRPGRFKSVEGYYATLFHELSHSTGHEKRLDRQGITEIAAFGSDKYSEEELVAEMGAAFLCGHVGIGTATIDNSAAYIHHWMQRLKEDKRLIVRTASQAQKAADFILGERSGQGRCP
ncbi:MAG: DUF1738 domain-containing protein [Lentisphaerae bacterium]|jgi:antirestriction protein ArdC|nr:DUF1738 domain-containing protein [Lentisphaerota bacterium]MBT5611647.1 DUF1738 domain-containing protein [Lentisphaerota bacterium]